MKNSSFATISDFAPTRRQLLGLGLVLAGAAAINVVPGVQL
ncbi:outer membrane lipoprotein carrier protein LolA, partial [Mesorhizobium sp. M6A.T.Ca.TU.002.02.2.1]